MRIVRILYSMFYLIGLGYSSLSITMQRNTIIPDPTATHKKPLSLSEDEHAPSLKRIKKDIVRPSKINCIPDEIKRKILFNLLEVPGSTELHKLIYATDAIKKFRMLSAAFKNIVDTKDMHHELITQLQKRYSRNNPIPVAVALGTPLAGQWLHDYDKGKLKDYILKAAENGQAQVVNFLILQGLSWDEETLDIVLLRSTITESSPFIIERLITLGANVNVISNEFQGSLHYASSKGNLETVKKLLEKNATVDQPGNEGKTALIWASFEGHIPIMEVLIKAGANINYKTSHNVTPLLAAVFTGQEEAVRYLLKMGATKDQGALEVAALYNKPAMIPLLVNAGIKVNGMFAGSTALMTAAQKGHAEVIKELIANGADVNLEDHKGYTALAYARGSKASNRKEIKRLLKQYGAH